MTTKPDDMEAEAEAILRVLDLALENRASKSAAEFHAAKVRGGAGRLKTAARLMRIRDAAEEGRAGE